MRILLLTHTFNSLTQRLFAELRADGHLVSVEFDIADSVTEEAVALFAPDVIVAPFLKRAVPESVWRRHLTLIVHPGVVGDRGPSALDWAIMNDESEWSVTVLQAEAEMDAGPVWATREFPMREATKASLYRNEVTAGALAAVREALGHVDDWRRGAWQPVPPAQWPNARGEWRALMRQADRRIDWAQDDTRTVLRKIRAADGFPGVADALFGGPCHLFDTRAGHGQGRPGEVIGRCGGALLRATVDGAVWIGHVKRGGSDDPYKLPAALAFADEAADVPEVEGVDEIDYRERDDGQVGYLSFDFYNGAMGPEQCRRLEAAIRQAGERPTRVLVLEGGRDFWSNGIHLNLIEAAGSAADVSWDNIQAMDDVCLAILQMTDKLTVATLRGNAGAGGCFLALAADAVWAREGVVLNPHYKNMGNLFGSEYWTYLLPKRVGAARARGIMEDRLPLRAQDAVSQGLIDACFGNDLSTFEREVSKRATAMASDPGYAEHLNDKKAARERDEAIKPLTAYRQEELQHMHRNFFGFDPSYHVARYHFVAKTPQSWTPRHLAIHREIGWQTPDTAETC
ncbi:hydrogenase maturation protein [Nitrogeniibacter aestuarii]|uniref:hydrogenase maturation protein n=1 Tax=Nitrogeniibacter aestuarii TaxID=2815343 RepID=UPI001E40E5D0|nr:hydrogenase maturation protein [Nitrogeniibacter aestuarii]